MPEPAPRSGRHPGWALDRARHGVTVPLVPRLVCMWTARCEATVTAEGPGDADMVSRLDDTLERLLHAGARHVCVDVHRLTGDDAAVLELLAATCHRIWSLGGSMEVVGLRDRLASRPEVAAFTELFGRLDGGGREGTRLR